MANAPKYPLEEIKRLLKNPDTRIIRRRDRAVAAGLGYPDDDSMAARILHVTSDEFYKTMEADDPVRFPDLWQDVYKSEESDGTKLYIKLQISSGSGVLITFKRDTSR